MSRKKNKIPDSIFEVDNSGEVDNEWRNMPTFNQPKNSAYRQVIVSFEDEAGIAEFFRLINQSYTDKTNSVWFPERLTNKVVDLFYYDNNTVPEDVKNNQNGTA